MSLILRPFEYSDKDLLSEINSDSSMATYEDWVAGEIDLDTELDGMVNQTSWNEVDSTNYFAIVVDDKAIGYIQATVHDYQQAEIGYYIVRSMAGNGYASKALRKFIQLAFDNEIHRCYCHIDPRHTASIKVASKCGMKYEGTMMHSSQIRGEWSNDAIYAVIGEKQI